MTALNQALGSGRQPADRTRRRRRWPWIASGVVLVLVVAVVVAAAVFQFGLPWWMREGDRNHMYKSDAGSLRYQVHLPPQYDGTTRLPVIVAIHGCGMLAGPCRRRPLHRPRRTGRQRHGLGLRQTPPFAPMTTRKDPMTASMIEKPDFTGLRAMYINCTLKRSPDRSHTQGVIDHSVAIMEASEVSVDQIRAVDHDIATGVRPDMTEYGWDTDEWPALLSRVLAADILVIAGPIWLGDNSSVTRRVIERLYGYSGVLNEHGQYAYYGRVGGCLITGNEDGLKHCAMSILYSLQHIGFTVPPQSDAGWLGEVGPGPSYLDEGSGGPDNDFTNRNIAFMTYNLLHLASMIRRAGGFPTYGNQRAAWDAGIRPGNANPEYR